MPNTADWTPSSNDVAMVSHGLLTRADRFADGLDNEERANQFTHGFGLLLSIPAAIDLWWAASHASDLRILFGATFYALTLVLLYAASTLSHSFKAGRARELSRLLDQVCIYLLTLGSVTPFALAYWPGWMVGTLLVGTWVVAVTGIVRKVLVEGPNRIVLWYYVALGWFPAMGIWHVISQMPFDGAALVVLGGLSYTGGVYFWLREGRIPYSHAVWHVCVLFGSFAHCWVIRWYVIADSPLTRVAG